MQVTIVWGNNTSDLKRVDNTAPVNEQIICKLCGYHHPACTCPSGGCESCGQLWHLGVHCNRRRK